MKQTLALLLAVSFTINVSYNFLEISLPPQSGEVWLWEFNCVKNISKTDLYSFSLRIEMSRNLGYRSREQKNTSWGLRKTWKNASLPLQYLFLLGFFFLWVMYVCPCFPRDSFSSLHLKSFEESMKYSRPPISTGSASVDSSNRVDWKYWKKPHCCWHVLYSCVSTKH